MIIPQNSTILAIGAHPDDIEISCSGFLLFLKEKYHCKIVSLICSKGELKDNETDRLRDQEKASKKLGVFKNIILNFNDGYISHNRDLVNEIEKILNLWKPEFVLTHDQQDYHQDHRQVALATISASRKLKPNILFYPSINQFYSFHANFFVDISSYFSKKIDILNSFDVFSSKDQIFSEKHLKIMTMEAGLTIGVNYAEKFQIFFTKLITHG